jgi:mannose-6-phosphate isomerase-like protein (cupin superfamily)
VTDGPAYKVLALEDLERVPLDHGVWRPVRRPLGVTAFGINAYTADHAGDSLIEPHDETSPGAGGHEELYLTATGTASFTVANQKVDAPAGTMLLVEPGTPREAVAAEDSTTVLVIGGRPGAAMPPSPFEYWYSAVPASAAGDLERAYAVVGEGLEHWPKHGGIHYALGCYAARLGRRKQALEHLRIAFAEDPRTREWAAEDSDLDAIRDDPGFP